MIPNAIEEKQKEKNKECVCVMTERFLHQDLKYMRWGHIGESMKVTIEHAFIFIGVIPR